VFEKGLIPSHPPFSHKFKLAPYFIFYHEIADILKMTYPNSYEIYWRISTKDRKVSIVYKREFNKKKQLELENILRSHLEDWVFSK
jgi:hypothetical protein